MTDALNSPLEAVARTIFNQRNPEAESEDFDYPSPRYIVEHDLSWNQAFKAIRAYHEALEANLQVGVDVGKEYGAWDDNLYKHFDYDAVMRDTLRDMIIAISGITIE